MVKLRLLTQSGLTIEDALLQHSRCEAEQRAEFAAVVEPNPKGTLPLVRCEVPAGLYVTEVNNHRVTRWAADGLSCAEILVGGFGRGAGSGQLAGPKGLCFDANGVMYVSEAGSQRVTRWCLQGHGALAAGGQTVVSGVEEPGGICVGARGEIYVADVRGHAVTCWTLDGSQGSIVAGGRGPGDGLDQLERPVDVAVDSEGFLYVAEFGNDRVTRWKDKMGQVVAGGTGWGDALENLASPTAICLQETRNGILVLVAEAGNHRVSRWTPGEARCEVIVGGAGSLPELETPTGLCCNEVDGSIYVAEAGSNRVTCWSPGALADTAGHGGASCDGA